MRTIIHRRGLLYYGLLVIGYYCVLYTIVVVCVLLVFVYHYRRTALAEYYDYESRT